MYYAIVRTGSDCDSQGYCYSGELSDIAESLLEESEKSFCIDEDKPLEWFEKEYYCEFSDYRALKECKDDPPESLIRDYSFILSDMEVRIAGLAQTPEEMTEMIEDEVSDYSLCNPISEEDMDCVFEELQMLLEDCDTDVDDLEYFEE